MKRGLNFYEAFFLILFICKATETKLFGHVPSGFIVFSPFFIAALYDIIERKLSAKAQRLRFAVWKFFTNRKAAKARKIAAKDMETFLKSKSANPGQAYDK